jgi:hypothetical protein
MREQERIFFLSTVGAAQQRVNVARGQQYQCAIYLM